MGYVFTSSCSSALQLVLSSAACDCTGCEKRPIPSKHPASEALEVVVGGGDRPPKCQKGGG